ncbi:DEAD-domain-containing protein [Trichocladium antarcticum]|uniref:ATP-dependent RNA helicase n=1 Tax=Trichocladium antarcticum TaxID=1450529 RepID=A0AAN6ZGL1_9PEZI|nr:DEAD-domain-containing protein [Trichocladium antarcticum]
MRAETGRVPYAEMAGRLRPELLQALTKMEITHLSPVQEKVLGLPSFKQDCLVQAKTGTGKTLAFLLPALQNLLEIKDLDRSKVGILVMAPTRELAQQIADECDKLTSVLRPGLECHVAVGGNKKATQLGKFLGGKPTILVATPGRLNDYLSDQAPRDKLNKVRCVVLDEADRMLDDGFMPELMRILSQIPSKAEGKWQGMCFSATMPPEINKVLHLVLKPDHAKITTIDKNEVPTVELVPQQVFPVPSINEILPTLHSVLACAKADEPDLKAIIFCPTARHAALMYHIFGFTGGAAPPKLPVFQMQSRMSQPARTRTIEDFKKAERGLLFASDVVGRGMDFPDIKLVIQIGVPSEKDQYVHRVGRTGRAGKIGTAVMILTPEEMWFVDRNPQFPIQNTGPFAHPKAHLYPSTTIISDALAKIPDQAKEQAYVANLGFTKSLMRHFNAKTADVVRYANDFATSIGCAEPPALQASTIGKMGLKGVAGLRVLNKAGAVTNTRAAGGPGGPPGFSGHSRPTRGEGRPARGRGGGARGGFGARDGGRGAPEGERQGEEPRHKRPRRE